MCVCVCVLQTTTNQKWSLSSYHRLKLDISPSCWQKKIEEWGKKTKRGIQQYHMHSLQGSSSSNICICCTNTEQPPGSRKSIYGMYSYTKLSPYSPCDEDCKVIVPWLALSHVQCTLKLAEVIGKSPTFSCMCKSSLIENSRN